MISLANGIQIWYIAKVCCGSIRKSRQERVLSQTVLYTLPDGVPVLTGGGGGTGDPNAIGSLLGTQMLWGQDLPKKEGIRSRYPASTAKVCVGGAR